MTLNLNLQHPVSIAQTSNILFYIKRDFNTVYDAIKKALMSEFTQKVNDTWKSVTDGGRHSLGDDKHTPTYSKTKCTDNIAK